MLPDFGSDRDLIARLTQSQPDRPIIFLAGAPLTGGRTSGVADVAGMQDLLRNELGEDIANAVERDADPDRIYQALMGSLGVRAGPQKVNELIRRGVLAAWRGHPVDFRDEPALRRCEKQVDDWSLTEGVRALGRLLSANDSRSPPIVLTTNFDPLIEVAVRAAGSQARPIVLDNDGRFDRQLDETVVKVVHLCGYWAAGDTLHVQTQLQKPRLQLADCLRTMLRGHLLVTIAYGGWEDVIAQSISDVLKSQGTPFDLAWTFYNNWPRKIAKDNTQLLERLEPAIGGRAQLYCGIDVHRLLPELVSCLSPSEVPPPPIGKDPWSLAASNSAILPDGPGNSLRAAVGRLVARLWRVWESAKDAGDPWRDHEVPIRILRSLELLVRGGISLHPGEKALAVAAPFVREAVLAAGVGALADQHPSSFNEQLVPSPLRRALEAEHRSRENLLRRARWLLLNGLTEDVEGVAWWLGHRALLRRKLIWVPVTERGGELPESLETMLAPDGDDQIARGALSMDRLLRVARCIGTADRLLLEGSDMLNQLSDSHAIGGTTAEPMREVLTGRILHIAGLLALDPRHLDEVLIDQLGAAPPLTPAILAATLKNIHWISEGRRLRLSGQSPHAAIELAVRMHVEAADLARERLIQADARLASLPDRLVVDTIEAKRYDNGIPMWERPHLRFELAPTEVRELLMGEQLYGEATVALRELYQNALDALRYRAARQQFVKQRDGLSRSDLTWKGEIRFEQSRSADHILITCHDNGVGMGMEELMGAFARAGRRFRDLPAFAEEEAEWLSCTPPIRVYPNSQFGVGVLSYFMLADEVRIRTTRYNRNGRLGPELYVHIAGAGALFHVTRRDEAGREAGTEIKLVLSLQRFREKMPSVVDVLQKWLVVADFDTQAREGSRVVAWKPGIPVGYPDAIAIPNSEPACWWVDGPGLILADGIRVDGIERTDGAAVQVEPFGAVVNQTGRHRARLSVDRSQMLAWRPEQASSALMTGLEALCAAPFMRIDWLCDFAQTWPEVANATADALIARKKCIPMNRENLVVVPTHVVGLDIADARLWSILRDDSPNAARWESISVPDVARRLSRWMATKELLPDDLRNMSLALGDGATEPLPRPGDVALRQAYLNVQGESRSCLLYVAALAQISAGEALERLRRAGVNPVPNVETVSLRSLTIAYDEIASLLILHGPDGELSLLSLDRVLAPGRLVRMAFSLGLTLADSVLRLRGLSLLNCQISADREDIPEIEPGDVVALSRDLDGIGPWILEVPLGHIYAASSRLCEAPSATWKRLLRYRSLGLTVRDLPLGDLDRLQPGSDDLSVLRFQRLAAADNWMDWIPKQTGPSAYVPWKVGADDLWKLAIMRDQSPSECRAQLARYEGLGLSLPDDPHQLDALPRSLAHLADFNVWQSSGCTVGTALVQWSVGSAHHPHAPKTSAAVKGAMDRVLELELLDARIGSLRTVRGAWLAMGPQAHKLIMNMGVDHFAKSIPEERKKLRNRVEDYSQILGRRLPDLSLFPSRPMDMQDELVLSEGVDGRRRLTAGTSFSKLHLEIAALRNHETYEQTLKRWTEWAPVFGFTLEHE